MVKKIFSLIGVALLGAAPCQADETDNFDVVTITVNAPSYDTTKPPVFARVKYNKLCPLVITSDDMGAGELGRNWAFFNGYPVFGNDSYGKIAMGNDFLDCPYNASAWGQQVKNLKRSTHQPLTYSDGTGGVRRFTATSAIWPHQVNNTNSTLINGTDAKVMIRTGWSFAQHDVDYSENDIKAGNYTAAQVAARFGPLSELWAEKATGIGLKVMVEPSGTHTYVDAGKLSDEICWNIFQNGVVGTYPEKKPVPISEWTTGTDWTTFGTGKPKETTVRLFFQGSEQAWKDAVNSADGSNIILGGTHGIGDDILAFTKELAIGGSSAKADQFWVAGADEVWEYYHLYNNAKIQNISYSAGVLTFEVKVPKYKKNQFRELTINIPGITGVTGCTFSDNVITGGAQQNDDYYTINIGLEDKIYTYIDELITYYRSHLHNTYVKDDAEYLIGLLLSESKRSDYQARIDAAPTYCSYQVTTSVGDRVLTSGAQDEAAAVTYTYPKYVLSGTDLYTADKNTAKPYYVSTFTPNSGTDSRTVTYTKAIENVAFFTEGEDMDGANYNPKAMSNINDSGKGEYLPYHEASNAAGGYITSPVTVTTVQPGKYNLVAAVGDSYNNANNYATFTFKLGDKSIFSFQTDYQGIKEYTKEAIIVKEEATLTVEATGSTTSRWIDYLYLVKTAEYDETVPEITLTAESTDIDITNGISPVTITATTTGYQRTSISETKIKDADGNILATNSGDTCTYEYTPTRLGNIVFIGEATDAENRSGVSEDFTITVKSDFTLTVTSNLGNQLASTTFTGQTADKNYRFLYPRYLLRGTDLYETEAKSTSNSVVHYGEDLTFSLANKNIERTVDYSAVKSNIVFYTEGENIEGARLWTNDRFDSGQGQSFALTLGSMGACGGIKSTSQGGNTLTTLPAGQYQLTAIAGCTNSTSTYYFKAGETQLGSFTPKQTTASLTTYTTDVFTLDETKTITISSTIGTDNSQNWVDLVYIQKVDAVPVSVTAAGYATFSSPYALDFTSSTIKAYTATVSGNVVNMTRQTGTVPAATGLFLQGTEGTALSEYIPLATAVPNAISNNALCAHLTTGEVEAGNYVLSGTSNGSQMAFRELTSDTKIPGGRAYLKIPGTASRTLLYVRINDMVTGIQDPAVNTLRESSYLYNLAGQKVGNNAKGIVIGKWKKTIKTK